MTVTPASYGSYTRLSGTIAEVLAALVAQQVGATNVIYYAESDANAVCVYHGTYQA